MSCTFFSPKGIGIIPSGGKCSTSDECSFGRCTKCPVEKKCGEPLGDPCESDDQCCNGVCDGKGICEKGKK